MTKIIISEWITPIILAAIIAIFIRRYIFFITLVSSCSMCPHIKPKDRIITTRVYNFSNIRRGDILVFYSPELQKMLIKRVIGLPNDGAEIKTDGSTYINQKKLDEPYVEYPGGLNHKFKVPAKGYLFLGDNRDRSHDSRSWLEPFIFEKDIRGKARFCLFPLNRIAKLK